ncbi:MAG: SMP-30/gluconolactonase/LRE family protein [Treponema sp.]|jgi:gluconolactonase|nr:SMP-30/gluconolactonase/LRE family protein [Treponema sp.]
MGLKLTEFSPAAKKIFSAGDDITMIASGYNFTEGPVWDIKKECLYFTDFRNDLILMWTKEAGAGIYRNKANRAIGLSMDGEGRIVSAESSSRCIAWADGEKSVAIAASYQGKKLNSPNDVVVSKSGDIFFTDPYSTALGYEREIDFNGVYTFNPGGETQLIYGGFGWPNGIALSPDESILYVNDTGLQQIFAFNITEKNYPLSPKIFATLDPAYGPGAPDGMKVDVEGNVYVTGPGGLWVLSPDGQPLVILHSPEFVGNFCFGGADSKTIFLTASTSVYRVPVGIPGIVPYRK